MLTIFASPIGLGHATRDIAIARELKTPLQFVSGVAAARLVANYGYPVTDAYSPPKFSVSAGQLQQSFRWLLSYYSYYKKCRATAIEFLRQNDGTVVSDEDFASVAAAHELGRKCILITDIMRTNFTSGPASVMERKMNVRMRDLIDKCDRVIVPDEGDDSGNRVHVGPIVREPSATREELRKSLHFDRPTILVCVGGTDAGRFLIEKAIEAYKKLNLADRAELVIVSGPSLTMPDSDLYRNLGFVDNLHEIILASDLVISLAGRSTMDESLAFGTPGIFIPIKNHFEQEEGAARLGFKFDDVFRLDQLVAEKLDAGRNPIAMNGAKRAAEIISSYL